MPRLHLKIVTPEKIVFERDVNQVTVPTMDGEITVLPEHIPLVSVLKPGELVTYDVDKKSEPISLAVSGGFIEVNENQVVILADTAERAEEIDVAKAQAAHERAKKLLADAKHQDSVEYAQLAVKIEKELARLRVSRKRHHGLNQPTIESMS